MTIQTTWMTMTISSTQVFDVRSTQHLGEPIQQGYTLLVNLVLVGVHLGLGHVQEVALILRLPLDVPEVGLLVLGLHVCLVPVTWPRCLSLSKKT